MTDSTDYVAGINAQNSGDFHTAQEKLALAYKKNGDDPQVRFSYASVAPCSTAVSIYKTIAVQSTTPDSIRGFAYVKLGDYSYAQKEYSKAIEYYRCASKYGKKSVYRHYWALALLASGNEEAARSLWYTLTLEYGDSLSLIAHYHLGMLNLKQKKYQEALTSFSKAGTIEPERPWTVAAIAGKIECARNLGMLDKVDQYESQLLPYRKLLLEENYLKDIQITTKKRDTISSSTVRIDTLDDTTDEKPDSLKSYTLQVGAFGLKENAQTLEKKIRTQFLNVSVVPVTVGEQVFYRVWIGSFKSKSLAESFAVDSLSKLKLSYKVVER